MIKIGYDTNGNKIAKYIPGSGLRGFSVQTLGNMPDTHRALISGDHGDHRAESELHAYVKQHGTPRQRELLGWS